MLAMVAWAVAAGSIAAPSQTANAGTAQPGEAATVIPFQSGSAGTWARPLFATRQDPNFVVTVEDLSFPPDGQRRRFVLPAAALLEFLSEPITVAIGDHVLDPAVPRAAVPAGSPITVVNRGELAAVVRVYLIAAKGR